MDPRIGWGLAALLALFAWLGYGIHGLAFTASAVIFWLLLTFSRAMRAMRNAGQAPVGSVSNAVMFHAGLASGMTMLQVLGKTKSLGRKVDGGDDDWRWSDETGASVVLHFEQGRLQAWQLRRPDVAT